jgi:hypothetical protein
MGDKLFNGWINPLLFIEATDFGGAFTGKNIDADCVIRYLCEPLEKADVEEILNRYREVEKYASQFFAAPNDEHVLEKLVWPLKNAIGCYMVGNYLGTISLCGMVAEMVAVLLFDISGVAINNNIMNVKTQENLFGCSFEKLGQDRRIKILSAYDLIDSDLQNFFDELRSIRKRYLHLYSQEHVKIAVDARKAIESSVQIVVRALGIDIHNGKLIMRSSFLRYLETKGIIQHSAEDDAACNQ